MPSKEFEKAEAELERLTNLHEGFNKLNDTLLADREILEELSSQVGKMNNELMPAFRKFLREIVEVRMSINREVQNILQTAANIKQIGPGIKTMGEFGDAVVKLNSILTPEFLMRLGKLVNTDGATNAEAIQKE